MEFCFRCRRRRVHLFVALPLSIPTWTGPAMIHKDGGTNLGLIRYSAFS
jgi:hypothetical protein